MSATPTVQAGIIIQSTPGISDTSYKHAGVLHGLCDYLCYIYTRSKDMVLFW